jgi:acyl-coenzyme A synthetase/AMP-(fatty) acid ligase
VSTAAWSSDPIVPGPFSEAFARFAGRPCLRASSRELSYQEVADLGRTLIATLPTQRALVLLRCSLTVECVAIYCALLAAGHVPLLLEANLAPELVDRIADTYAVDAILDGEGGTQQRAGGTSLHPDLALLLSTSGSTGSPKLVRLSHAGLAANAASVAQSLALDEAERPLLHLPMSYSYGLSIIHSHLLTGGCICLTRHSVMESGYFDDMAAHAATSIAGVPFHYTALRRWARSMRPHCAR